MSLFIFVNHSRGENYFLKNQKRNIQYRASETDLLVFTSVNNESLMVLFHSRAPSALSHLLLHPAAAAVAQEAGLPSAEEILLHLH